MATVAYGTYKNSAIKNAAAPITGGNNCPPVEATASIAAALCAGYPLRLIMGMVTTPVDITLATALPEMEPKIADAITAIFMAPPRKPPISMSDTSVKNLAPPTRLSVTPNKTKAITTVHAICSGMPRMPFASKDKYDAILSHGWARPAKRPGMRCPAIA